MTLTVSRLRELLHYDLETGHFTWIVTVGRVKAGKRAGSGRNASGYIGIRIDRACYVAQRLAHLYMTGSWPPADHDIHHKNENKEDNSWLNLECIHRREHSHRHGGCKYERRRGRWWKQCKKCQRFLPLSSYTIVTRVSRCRNGGTGNEGPRPLCMKCEKIRSNEASARWHAKKRKVLPVSLASTRTVTSSTTVTAENSDRLART